MRATAIRQGSIHPRQDGTRRASRSHRCRLVSRIELLSFPAGKHDDQVDALGLIGQLLDQMVPGQAPKKPEPSKPDTGYRPICLGESANDWLCY
jgi:hypothetical protein